MKSRFCGEKKEWEKRRRRRESFSYHKPIFLPLPLSPPLSVQPRERHSENSSMPPFSPQYIPTTANEMHLRGSRTKMPRPHHFAPPSRQLFRRQSISLLANSLPSNFPPSKKPAARTTVTARHTRRRKVAKVLNFGPKVLKSYPGKTSWDHKST